MFDNLTPTAIVTQATEFSGMFENPIMVAIGLGVCVTIAYAIKNMF